MIAEFRKLFYQSLVYGLGTLVTKLAGFVLIPVYTSIFSVEQFGILGLLEVSAQVAIAVFGFALYSGFFRWYWDENAVNRRKSLFFTLSFFQILLVIAGFVILMPFTGKLASGILGSSEFGYLIRWMLAASFLQLILLMPNTLLRLQERPWLFTIANTLQFVFSLLITIYFIVYRHSGIEGIYYGQIAGSIAYLIVLLRFTISNMELRLELDLLREIITFCFPLFLSSLALVILNVTDRFFIKHLGKLSDVGLYAYGFKLANILSVFLVTSVNFAIQPLIYNQMNKPGNRKFYSLLLTYYTFGVLVVGLAMMVFGKEITRLFALQVEYYDAWVIFPFIIFSVVFGMMKDVAVTGMNIAKKTSLIAFTVVIAALLNWLLNLWLIPALGNKGAALAKMLSMMAFFITTLAASQKYFKIPYELKRLSLMLLVAAALYLISLLCNELQIYIRISVKILIAISFPVVLSMLNFYRNEEKLAIRCFVLKWCTPENFLKSFRQLFNKSSSND